ncbi:hypothetical protein N7535_002023 [Penicillium sp. DV-2018c]|nr:hypothetical protein N7535_002023 [Penicillium sp. DV-2018c]
MAAPQETTIQNLTGNWVLNKTLTTEADSILKLQKIPWLLRKAFALGTIYINISQYKTPDPEQPDPDPKSERTQPKYLTHVNFTQTSTGRLAGTTENRILDWKIAEHEDYVFGSVHAQAEYVFGVRDADGKIRPDVRVMIDDANEEMRGWLRGCRCPPGKEREGFLVEGQREDVGRGDGLWIHTFERSEGGGWVAEQVWGFEVIGGERYFSRRVVVMEEKGKGKGRYICGRIVFDFLGREE